MRGEGPLPPSMSSSLDSYSPLRDTSFFSGPRFIESQESYLNHSDMPRVSVCDVSMGDIESPPYQPKNTLPRLVKSNTTSALAPVRSKLKYRKRNPPPSDHAIDPTSHYADNILVEIFRTDVSFESSTCETENQIYSFSDLSMHKLKRLIGGKFRIPLNFELRIYDPRSQYWNSVDSEIGLQILIYRCLELHHPLKVSFRATNSKFKFRGKVVEIDYTRPTYQQREYTKILLLEIKHESRELPYLFSSSQVIRNERITQKKQDAFAETLENKLIATRW